MANISVRLDDDLKKQMEKFPHLNWSEIIRSTIKTTIVNEKEKNLAKAVLLNEQVYKDPNDDIDSTEIIRKFREERR